MMDIALKHARALYQDRQRMALAAFIIAFSVTLYVFYSPGIYGIGIEPPAGIPDGMVRGFEVVYSFNTVGFFLAFSVMVFMYGFWSYAFLPQPANNYTADVLRGIYGSRSTILRRPGKRFRVNLDSGSYVEVRCRIRESDSGEWFVYKMESSPLQSPELHQIALRHGLHLEENRFASWVSNDELHHRMILLNKAIRMASA